MEQHSVEEQKKVNRFDFKRFLVKLLKNYIWIIGSVFLFAGCTFLYLRYTVPMYQVAAYLQIAITQDAGKMAGATPFSPGASAGRERYVDLNGEIFKLQSKPLIAEVVDSLRLNVEVTRNDRMKNEPLDIAMLPFTVVAKVSAAFSGTAIYVIKLKNDYYLLEKNNKILKAAYGSEITIDHNTITLNKKDGTKNLMGQEYRLMLSDKRTTVDKYNERLTVGSVPKGGLGMLQLVLRDEIVDRAKQFIEVLKYRYDYSNYVFKNRALQSEIEFLDQRVTAVDAELERQENYVKNFKAGNKITDVASSANQLLGSLANIETKKSDNVYKENLLKLVESNINSSAGQEERLNVTGISDVDLVALVSRYNDLVLQKKNIALQAAPRDLRLPPINAKLTETRNGIINRIQSLKEELSANNAFLASQERNTSGLFSTLPSKEKDFIQVNRLLNIKQALYVFLLQRKEDKSIEFASSGIADSRTVDWQVSNVQDPKPSILYGISLFLGLLVPAAVIFTKVLLNKKIETSKEINQATSLPVIGEIAFAGKVSEEKIVIRDSTSAVAEHFRTLRTNLFFHCHGRHHNAVLVTSGTSGEGKSYVSLNLASAIAISGKKTILLEFDLRDPGIMREEEISKRPGIINFLNGEMRIDEIIQPLEDCPQLSFISAGFPLSINTGERILDRKMGLLFEYLKKQYDFIIIDTPPVEAVSDALILSEWADFSLFVIRHKYSTHSSIELINKLHEDSKTPNALLVINSIQPGGDFNNVHGYGYGYGSLGKYNKKKKGVRPHLKIA